MVLKKITVRDLGSIDFFAYDFTNGLNVIKKYAADDLAYAIRTVLNSKAMPSLPAPVARETSEIQASVYVNEKAYRLEAMPDEAKTGLKLHAYGEGGEDVTSEYLHLSSHCEEQDLSEVFDGKDKTCRLRFLSYMNDECRGTASELSESTDGLSDIRAFRAYLRSFVKGFTPELIREGKQYEIVLSKNGVYDVRLSPGGTQPVCLSESEQILFRYLCFLRTAEFWRGFEEIRNLHGVKKPLIVKDFLERLDGSIDIGELIRRALDLKRQVILLTLPGESRV